MLTLWRSVTPQAYTKSKLTAKELAKQATDAAAEYTGAAQQAAQEVGVCCSMCGSQHVYRTVSVLTFLSSHITELTTHRTGVTPPLNSTVLQKPILSYGRLSKSPMSTCGR